jgi:hypothetical protein
MNQPDCFETQKSPKPHLEELNQNLETCLLGLHCLVALIPWSRFLTPGAEAVDSDVLSVLDWAQRCCLVCGSVHWALVYALRVPTIHAASRDQRKYGHRTSAVSSFCRSGSWPEHWNKLQTVSIQLRKAASEGFIRLRHPRDQLCTPKFTRSRSSPTSPAT